MSESCGCSDPESWTVDQKPMDMGKLIEQYLPPGLRSVRPVRRPPSASRCGASGQPATVRRKAVAPGAAAATPKPAGNAGPRHNGAIFTESYAQAMADCEGETYLAGGVLPRRYSNGNAVERNWGEVESYEPDYLWLLTGECEKFTLRILTSNTDYMRLDGEERYCGYVVVTRVEGAVDIGVVCLQRGAYVQFTIAGEISVWRALVEDGVMVKVLETEFKITSRWPNEDASEDYLHHIYYHTESSTRTVYTPGFGGEYPIPSVQVLGPRQAEIGIYTSQGCEGLGNSLITPLDDILYQAWTSQAAWWADASVLYLGPASAGVAASLYLLKNSAALDDCAGKLRDYCQRLPLDCDPDSVINPDGHEGETQTP
jgi:hypothetical protein